MALNDDDMEIDDVDEAEVSFLAEGTMVELTGLKGAAQLNGELGAIVCYFEDKDRYQVDLGNNVHKKVRTANIRVCEDQKLTKASWINKNLAKKNSEIFRQFHQMNYEAEQRKAMYMMGALFTFLILFMLVQTGALGYIYRDSFAAPYLQMVGEPVYENVLLPTYEKALVPAYENIILPANKHIVQPVLGVLKQISDALAEHVLRPLQSKILQPFFDNVLKPVFDVVSGITDGLKDSLKSVLEPIFGSGGDSPATEAAEETISDTLGEAASTPLVDEIEHTGHEEL